MERLIDLFCHAIRISDPLSMKIAVGIIGGGLPLIFIVAALTKLGEFSARQRRATVLGTPGENAVPEAPDRGKESAGRRSRSVRTTGSAKKMVPLRTAVSFTSKSGHVQCSQECGLSANCGHRRLTGSHRRRGQGAMTGR